MILVTGATGTVGGAVVTALRSAGTPVRVLTRDPARAVFPPDVEVVTGDLGRPETLTSAVSGVEKVFLLSPAEHKAEHDGNLARAARDAGVRHVVQLSSLAAAEDPDGPLARWHL
ncbi:NAD(P)H-binding protein, partial [Actinosynnema sp. NPDC023658]|uniref:SDR family oxidoreductase n=1 Tax=Actinosynnema sp. NPDC023658 TaxID=3155465 RepID=UPI0033E57AE9